MTAEEKVKAKYPDAWRSVTSLAVRIFADKLARWGDAIGIALTEKHGQKTAEAAWEDAASRIEVSA